MLADSRQWQLFGLDLTRVVRYVRAGCKELFVGETADIRRHIDVPVSLLGLDGSRRFCVAEKPLPAGVSVSTDHVALEFPADRVLFRRLSLPRVLELELEDAVAMEVSGSSPFEADNTVSGWRVTGRTDSMLELSLAIAARNDVLAWLQERRKSLLLPEGPAPEVWVLDPAGNALVLSGFGEVRRLRLYPRRVAALAGRTGIVLLCILLLFALPGTVRSLQAQRMAGFLAAAQQEAAEAQRLRETLMNDNAHIEELQGLIDRHVDHHAILEQLSGVTPDSVFLQNYTLSGERLRLTGQAINAAAYMQLLTEIGLFESVSTPSAFTRDRRSGLERFVLDMRITRANGSEVP